MILYDRLINVNYIIRNMNYKTFRVLLHNTTSIRPLVNNADN